MTIETLESEFAEALTTIASGLGIAAERIFGMFVSAQPIIGLLSIVSCATIMALAYLTYKVVRRALVPLCTDDDGEWNNNDDEMFATILPPVIGILSMVMWCIIIGSVRAAMLKICCPEYTAMQEIISLVIP